MDEKELRTSEDGEKTLQDSIESLEEQIEEANSKPRIFVKGIFRGLGTAVGATVIFAIVVSLLSWFISVTDIPWLENFLGEVGLGEMFEDDDDMVVPVTE